MPPLIPRAVMPSPSWCRTCFSYTPYTPYTPLFRTFSTTQPNHKYGPESPKFIEVPQPRQSRPPPKRRIKGILPVPRNIFSRRRPTNLTSEYFAAVTPEPTAPEGDVKLTGEQGELVAWKRRMAAMRRRNLREGLVGLYNRKKQTDRVTAARSAFKAAERERLLNEKEREDVRLTSPTIPQSLMQLQRGPLPDPDRAQRIAEKVATVQAKQNEKAEERRGHLHTLYMHARDFITTEEQLNEAIERIFVPYPEEFVDSDKGDRGENIWNTGPPETVQEMLNRVNRVGERAADIHEGLAVLTDKRVKRIAEELTGGKMDPQK
ncbi:hypothetical protein FGG08_005147 [Glutinoglossum americanum]|uniref:Uncharacterized protein n=1 Tax=Glutinoglossum americanum TaxID=1670608 RepID=A0A9P8L1R5_9PEZI|nr:hypothetical protein FGG08_005147 [Glutinoglossum americanum]